MISLCATARSWDILEICNIHIILNALLQMYSVFEKCFPHLFYVKYMVKFQILNKVDKIQQNKFRGGGYYEILHEGIKRSECSKWSPRRGVYRPQSPGMISRGIQLIWNSMSIQAYLLEEYRSPTVALHHREPLLFNLLVQHLAEPLTIFQNLVKRRQG